MTRVYALVIFFLVLCCCVLLLSVYSLPYIALSCNFDLEYGYEILQIMEIPYKCRYK
jgi:hypothetical protein